MVGMHVLRPFVAALLGFALCWRVAQGARVQSEVVVVEAADRAAEWAEYEEALVEASGRAADVAEHEDQNPVGGMAAASAAARAARARREREERERRAKAERERRAKEQRERERRAEEQRKKEQHRRENLQDCVYTEQWDEWGECSAECGGGISTKHLVSLEITTPQDKYGYGKPCPAACSPSTTACTTRKFKPCAPEMCSTDCSTVDLNNRLTAAGSPAGWEFAREAGDCVFQLWQVISGADGQRIRLLGQTDPQVHGADSTVYSSSADEPTPYILQAQSGDVSFSDVAIGFRGCTLKAKGEGAPAVARVCHWGGEAFAAAAQKVELDPEQTRQLAEYRKESGETWGRKLAMLAGKATGVGKEDGAVTFEGAGDAPGFAVQATMAPRPPDAPELGLASADDGGVVRIKLQVPPRDNGAALLPTFKVSVRRVFESRAFSDIGRCKPVPLPECQEGSNEPCLGAAAEPLLRNLPLASSFEVEVAAQNAAGVGQPAKKVVYTRGNSSLPLQECQVAYWSCTSADGESRDYGPSAGDARCQLTAPPLPLCRMTLQRSFFWGTPKCDGKKYFRQCTPVLSSGSEKGCVGPRQTVCVHEAPEVDEKPNKKCEVGGCSKSFLLWNQKTCCCLSEADTEDDSPNCACTKGKCPDLGLVQAKNPNSCRH